MLRMEYFRTFIIPMLKFEQHLKKDINWFIELRDFLDTYRIVWLWMSSAMNQYQINNKLGSSERSYEYILTHYNNKTINSLP